MLFIDHSIFLVIIPEDFEKVNIGETRVCGGGGGGGFGGGAGVCVCRVCVCMCMSVCLSVCISLASDSSKTIKVITIKLGMVTTSDVIMHHVLIILTLTFMQGHIS